MSDVHYRNGEPLEPTPRSLQEARQQGIRHAYQKLPRKVFNRGVLDDELLAEYDRGYDEQRHYTITDENPEKINILSRDGLDPGGPFREERIKNLIYRGQVREMLDLTEDIVNHPSHYNSGNIEVWDFIVDQNLDYLRGNVVKYVSRAGKKDPSKELEDLEKAQAYLGKAIKILKDNQKEV